MNILYLTENISDYGSAFYQQDVLEHLQRKHTVMTYGPKYSNYDSTDDLDNILSKCALTPDLICIGHKWLRDDPTQRVDPHPRLDLSDTDIPTAMILNKEYTNFEEKIKYIERNQIPLVFTHHHYADQWSDRFHAKFVFWPFAVNDSRFKDYGEEKTYDLSFSGLLRNPNPDVPQTDLRIRVQDELFHTIGDLKLFLRSEYNDYNIFWRVKTTSYVSRALYKLLHRESRLPEEEYKRLYNKSKLTLNTLSPVNLVGTRYYEAMASNSLAFCQESSIYTEYDLFEPGEHCVTFKQDLSDFQEKLEYYTKHNDKREQIAQNGHAHVMNNHTWSNRIEEFTREIEYMFY